MALGLLAIYEVFGSSVFPNVPNGPPLHHSYSIFFLSGHVDLLF